MVVGRYMESITECVVCVFVLYIICLLISITVLQLVGLNFCFIFQKKCSVCLSSVNKIYFQNYAHIPTHRRVDIQTVDSWASILIGCSIISDFILATKSFFFLCIYSGQSCFFLMRLTKERIITSFIFF